VTRVQESSDSSWPRQRVRADTKEKPALQSFAFWIAVAVSTLVSGAFIAGSILDGVAGWAQLYTLHVQTHGFETTIRAATWLLLVYASLGSAGSAVLVAAGKTGIGYRPPRLTGHRRGLSPAAAIGIALIVLTVVDALGRYAWTVTANMWHPMAGPHLGDAAPDLTSSPSPAGIYAAAATGIGAGLVEEVCALAVPICLGAILADTAARHRWVIAHPRWRTAGLWVLAAVLVLIRVGYHLYYGPPAFALAPWAIATVALYLWMRRLWPIIIAHFAWDFLVGIANPLHVAGWQKYAIVVGVPVAIGGLLIAVAHRRHRPTTAVLPGADPEPVEVA